MMRRLILIILANLFFFGTSYAQTTTITYQGRLTDGGPPATGPYDLQFTLWDALTNGNQLPVGSPITIAKSGVSVANGIFTVQLDFTAASFPGAGRFLEISAKHPADASFTLLTPRQQITSSPYSIRTISAGTADSLSSACVGCVTDAKVASGISYAKLTGAPTSLPPSGTAGGDLTGSTYPNPIIAPAAVTGSKIAGTTITNANIANSTLVASAKLNATGTPSVNTFLRGDNAWATPTASQTDMFTVTGTCPNAATAFSGISGTGTVFFSTTSFTPPNDLRAAVMGYAGTATTLLIRGFDRSGTGTNNVTIKVYKNNALQTMTATIAANAAGTYFTASDAVNSFAFSANDTISYVMTQSNPAPVIVDISITLLVVH